MLFVFLCLSFRCHADFGFVFVGLAETATDLEKSKAVCRGKKCQTKTTTKLIQKVPWAKLLSQCSEVNLYVVLYTPIRVCLKEMSFALLCVALLSSCFFPQKLGRDCVSCI